MNSSKPVRKYLRAVKRKLFLPRTVCRRALRQLAGKLPQEASYASIVSSAGSPAETASGIQAAYPRFRKSPWRFLWLGRSILGISGLLCIFILQLAFPFCLLHTPAASVGIIGGADGPTAIYVTGAPIWYLPVCFALFLALAGLGAAGYLHFRHLKK